MPLTSFPSGSVRALWLSLLGSAALALASALSLASASPLAAGPLGRVPTAAMAAIAPHSAPSTSAAHRAQVTAPHAQQDLAALKRSGWWAAVQAQLDAAAAATGVDAASPVTLTGEPASQFGQSLASAGDVNGDGYDDVVVGAYGYNSSQGRAYLYLGSANGLHTTPALTLTGEAASDFGWSVASAGDVNADGYADLVVGARQYSSNRGRAYVYLGGPAGLGATPALTLTGEPSSFFGSSVSGAADVNGDGYSDLVVGAQNYNSAQGRAYVYVGSPAGLAATPALTLTGAAGSALGNSVSGAGDVNGDGYADIVIGAFDDQSLAGRAFLYLGGPGGVSAAPALTLTGESASNFGVSVGGAGDVNGDGYADFMVGAFNYNSQQGRAYLYLGKSGGASATPALTLTGELSSNFGRAVNSAGDVNGDGYADFAVGAFNYGSGRGRAYLYLGSAGGLSATPVLTLTGEAASAFGKSVAGAGDVDGDGYTDLLIGANTFSSSQGRAYLFSGLPGVLGAVATPALAGQAGDFFGSAVASAGDVNGDGYADVIVGGYNALTVTGRAWLYLGGSAGLSATPAQTFTGQSKFDYFGSAVSGAGDVNGDGYADVLIGADGYLTSTGRAYLYLGSASGLGAVPALTLTGASQFSFFGQLAAGAGDVNGDGFADVAVAAPGFNFDQGRAFLYLGSAAGLRQTPALTLTGEAHSVFASGLSSAGDVNGDGYSDLLIGAPNFLSYTGRAYLFLGGAGGLRPTPALTLTGEAVHTLYGSAVAGAGDLNGDGLADFVVGANAWPNFNYQGRAYVYLGSAGALSAVPAITLTGENNNDQFGFAVAGAGDVNGDGLADLAIDANDYNGDQGRVYLYLGGPGGVGATPALSLTGESGSNFGSWLATAGDVNGDGYAELAVGTAYADHAYIFTGNESLGLALKPRLRRADDTAPLADGGRSDSRTGFRIAALGRTPFGRGKVKLQWEVKPLGALFDGAALQQSAAWLDTGLAGVALDELVANLSASKAYHWRVRLLYNPVTTPLALHSRWLTQPWNGWNETDVRTAADRLFLPLILR